MVFLPSQNVSLTAKEMRVKPQTLEGWLQVELFFYKKLELRDRDGRVILSGADEIDLEPPPQLISITDARILDNCPEGVPVWKMYKDRPRTFPLQERNSFVVIFKKLPLFFQLKINSQIWNLTCDEIQNCFTKTSESPKFSIIKDNDQFKVFIDDDYFDAAPSIGKDKVHFEEKSGSFYLAIPKEQEPEATTNDRSNGGLLTALGLISFFLIVSVVLNAVFTCYLRNRVCGLGKSTQNNNMHDASVVKDQIPATPSEGHEGGTHQGSYYLPMNQYLSPGRVQNATINESNQEVGEDSESPYINCQFEVGEDSESPYINCPDVMPPTVPNRDYIIPNEVKPVEVVILQNEKVIHGQVFMLESGQEKKHVPRGEYIDLTEVKQDISIMGKKKSQFT
ncbi:uncharacterized protein [Macrobrachium rosenbergii]|uniref:uncharacterized protein isoform X2 n=1 Tax=Macrobrachium rosenbergii TaxID=79674 RepID=UPI0034D74AFB